MLKRRWKGINCFGNGDNPVSDIKTPVMLTDIQQVVQQIVERFHPQKIFLFGSYAHGIPTADSDVDLLIEMETPLRNVDQAVEIRKSVDFPFPTDLLVRNPQQIVERLAMGDVFLREVVTNGMVLYEADNAGMD
jgi:predicted nucleotidyltransferase